MPLRIVKRVYVVMPSVDRRRLYDEPLTRVCEDWKVAVTQTAPPVSPPGIETGMDAAGTLMASISEPLEVSSRTTSAPVPFDRRSRTDTVVTTLSPPVTVNDSRAMWLAPLIVAYCGRLSSMYPMP